MARVDLVWVHPLLERSGFEDLEARRQKATGEERRALTVKLARLWHEAASFGRAAR